MQVQLLRAILVSAGSKLLSHLLHDILDHIDISYLAIIEIVLHLVKILFGETFICFQNGSLLLVLWRVIEHALFVAINTKAVKVLDTWNRFFQIVELVHLLKLLQRELLDEDWLYCWHLVLLRILLPLKVFLDRHIGLLYLKHLLLMNRRRNLFLHEELIRVISKRLIRNLAHLRSCGL